MVFCGFFVALRGIWWFFVVFVSTENVVWCGVVFDFRGVVWFWFLIFAPLRISGTICCLRLTVLQGLDENKSEVGGVIVTCTKTGVAIY